MNYTKQYKKEIIREMEWEIAKANEEKLSTNMSNYELKTLVDAEVDEAIAIGEEMLQMIDGVIG